MDVSKEAIFLTKTPSEEEISTSAPNFAREIEATQQGIKKYRHALVELAK